MTGASSRRRGIRAEADAARWLTEHGFEAITGRNATGGHQQGADIICPDLPVALEVKNGSRDELPRWIDQARDQADETAPGAVLHKRRGKGDPGEWFLSMTLADFVDLVGRLRWNRTSGRRCLSDG